MSFGPLAQGQRNDGINIAADRGAEVKAAADGVVVYAGSEVKGYGDTAPIMHPGGWDTVYTHLDKIEVGNRGFAVKQGQVIGTVGSTGDVDQPELHFETRFLPGRPSQVQSGRPADRVAAVGPCGSGSICIARGGAIGSAPDFSGAPSSGAALDTELSCSRPRPTPRRRAPSLQQAARSEASSRSSSSSRCSR